LKNLDYPIYSELSQFSVVPINVKQNKKARVAWLNKSWFREHGVDLSVPSTHDYVTVWLTEVFGVHVNPQGRHIGHFADRYGGTGGAPHGGSGRCISIGALNSKGNGATPLVANNTSHSYKHGRLQFSQAMKQAIMSAVCEKRFPYGSIPVVAVIDLGFTFDFRKDGESERCAAVVRPNFIRAAHLERSIFFGQAGFAKSDQFQDSQSVKSYCQLALTGRFTLNDTTELSPSGFVDQWVDRVCDQLGYGRAHRIWGDNLVSSNTLLNGGWCDLELFQTLPNFGRCYNQVNNVFGQEANSVLQAARSLEFYLSKTSRIISNNWRKRNPLDVEKTIHERFLRHAIAALTPSECNLSQTGRLRRALTDLYRHDQAYQYHESKLLKSEDHDPCNMSDKRKSIMNRLYADAQKINHAFDLAKDDTDSMFLEFFGSNCDYFGVRLRSQCESMVEDVFVRTLKEFSEIQSFCDDKIKSF